MKPTTDTLTFPYDLLTVKGCKSAADALDAMVNDNLVTSSPFRFGPFTVRAGIPGARKLACRLRSPHRGLLGKVTDPNAERRRIVEFYGGEMKAAAALRRQITPDTDPEVVQRALRLAVKLEEGHVVRDGHLPRESAELLGLSVPTWAGIPAEFVSVDRATVDRLLAKGYNVRVELREARPLTERDIRSGLDVETPGGDRKARIICAVRGKYVLRTSEGEIVISRKDLLAGWRIPAEELL